MKALKILKKTKNLRHKFPKNKKSLWWLSDDNKKNGGCKVYTYTLLLILSFLNQLAMIKRLILLSLGKRIIIQVSQIIIE